MILVSIRDVVADEFGDVATYKSKEVAVRSFDTFCEKVPFRDDLQLYQVGEFDPDTGLITPCNKFIKNGVLKDGTVEL